uniref:Putative secreted peptide n=1 Tax=Anopheles braziliensis TaxID=58242 RepID=A0A2M3ZN37_9DIPT
MHHITYIIGGVRSPISWTVLSLFSIHSIYSSWPTAFWIAKKTNLVLRSRSVEMYGAQLCCYLSFFYTKYVQYEIVFQRILK